MTGLSLDGAGPLKDQIYRALRGAIAQGRLGLGARIPSTRELAAELGLSRNTTIAAYSMLEEEGFIESLRGAGARVVRSLRAEAPPSSTAAAGRRHAAAKLSAWGERLRRGGIANPYAGALERAPLPYDFIYGIPPVHELPHEVWRRLVASRARRRHVMSFVYGPSEGLAALREAIAQHLLRFRGLKASSEQVIVVAGYQQALDLAMRLLVDPGSDVALEDPQYLGTRLALMAAGARLRRVPVDEEGIQTRALERVRRARLLCITPSHQFPTGAVLSLERRLQVLDWARRAGAFVLEDDYDTEYRYEGRPLESLQGIDRDGRVLYAGTFSKVVFPAMRLGYLVVPERLVEPFRTAKWLADWSAPLFEQEVLADFMASGHFERHLRRSRQRNAERRAALVSAIGRHLAGKVAIAGAPAGLHALVWLSRPSMSVEVLIERARRQGVGVYPVAPYYLRAPRRDGLLLGYGTMNPEEIHEGIRRLSVAWSGAAG